MFVQNTEEPHIFIIIRWTYMYIIDLYNSTSRSVPDE